MAPINTTMLKLESNSKEVYNETTRLLIKIADNIIKDPTNLKIRTLQKSNITILKKILSVAGGLECLKLMGFEENEATLVLPPSASLTYLQTVRNEITSYHGESSKAQTCDESNAFAALIQSSPNFINEGAASNDNLSSSDSASSDESETVNATKGAIPKVLKQQADKNQSDNNVTKIQVATIPHDVPKVKLPPLTYIYSNSFLRGVELSFHMALAYADKDLHERAKHVIPIKKLEGSAQNRLRTLQEQVKKGNSDDPNVSLQDMLILELLSWFKNDFFTWVDSPDCVYCGGKTNFSHMSSDPLLKIHTERVEMHKCTDCHQLTAFPRYNDVNILLITRRGRCGEWANTFTLLCCAMGWDARHVVDQGDHVWTEVYSFAQKRWLHCDPCENACDTPLIYENGWGKQLSYVIAYSNEEVQDVTWRYSSHHTALLRRRTQCTENELVDAQVKLRELRQNSLSSARKEYLTKRLLCELIELMVEKKPNEVDKQGRSSGSLAWRLTRGEIQANVSSSYCWRLVKEDTDVGDVTLRYSAALDQYECISYDGSLKASLKEWHAGTFSLSDVFRKEEKDWKMVYLARKEGAVNGNISWKFVLDNPDKVIDKIDIKFDHKLYENGNVVVQVKTDSASLDLPASAVQFVTSAFMGSKSIIITARLSGGKGDVAWQHAQLFRQSLTSNEYPFSVTFSFKAK